MKNAIFSYCYNVFMQIKKASLKSEATSEHYLVRNAIFHGAYISATRVNQILFFIHALIHHCCNDNYAGKGTQNTHYALVARVEEAEKKLMGFSNALYFEKIPNNINR